MQEAESALRKAQKQLQLHEEETSVAENALRSLQRQANQASRPPKQLAGAYISVLRHNSPTGLALYIDALLNKGDLLASLGAANQITELTEPAAAQAYATRASTALNALTERITDATNVTNTLHALEPGAEVEYAQNQLAQANAELSAFTQTTRDPSSTLASDAHQPPQLIDGWTNPLAGAISDHYGPRPQKPLPNVSDFHKGTDIAAACGTPVYAAAAGTVIASGPTNGGLGTIVEIDHGADLTTVYAHLLADSPTISAGDRVDAGDHIAAVGSTGASTGCHLHLEVRTNGTTHDPVTFFRDRGIRLAG